MLCSDPRSQQPPGHVCSPPLGEGRNCSTPHSESVNCNLFSTAFTHYSRGDLPYKPNVSARIKKCCAGVIHRNYLFSLGLNSQKEPDTI
ncbi:hypothetical protein NPIL_14821 [Nephila pilipes]|uniref:Uncharacterized protein n=1 Tax=Nephila pilipes TaxID=299642 RepID=A0A8X6QF11_NEPPI|nr:hypothetical protein NPIL_14821 [Nephila pilipes]